MPDRENQTAETLIELYYNFMSCYQADIGKYFLDAVVLKDISRRYWRDVERLHKFHNIKYIDNHKIAGYLTYWIVKLRPISAVTHDTYTKRAKTALFINELFSLYAAVGRINYHLQINGINKPITLDKAFLENFFYTLKYRPVTGDSLSLLYYFIETK